MPDRMLHTGETPLHAALCTPNGLPRKAERAATKVAALSAFSRLCWTMRRAYGSSATLVPYFALITAIKSLARRMCAAAAG
jgi:hypothetical protein